MGPALDPLRLLCFDLDGTLVDTAPDLASALNQLRAEAGYEALPYERVRCRVSDGSSALIRLAFGHVDDTGRDFLHLRARFLALYEADLARESRLFPGMEEVLERLCDRDMAWGIVTNKPGWLTEPLLRSLGLLERATCVVSGDSTINRKPHPEPLLYAAEISGRRPGECIYVGDSPRDIEAGRAAGMVTLVARYGYIDPAEDPGAWGADGSVSSPAEILPWLDTFRRERGRRGPA